MQIMSHSFCRSILTAAMLLGLSANADAAEVGWIDGFDGPAESFVILRDNEKVDGAIFEPIHEGRLDRYSRRRLLDGAGPRCR